MHMNSRYLDRLIETKQSLPRASGRHTQIQEQEVVVVAAVSCQLERCQARDAKKETTLAGLEPTRDKPNRFLVDRLNHSATVSSVQSAVAQKFVK